jgi:hypothetical protein
MSRRASIVVAVVCFIAGGLLVQLAHASYLPRPQENPHGRISTVQVRHQALRHAAGIARDNGAQSYSVPRHECKHLRRSAVDCNVRFRYVDPGDGYVTVEHWVEHGIACTSCYKGRPGQWFGIEWTGR